METPPHDRYAPLQADHKRQLMATPELAERLGVTERFVRRLVGEDRVQFLKIGKFVRFDPGEMDEWLSGLRRNPPY